MFILRGFRKTPDKTGKPKKTGFRTLFANRRLGRGLGAGTQIGVRWRLLHRRTGGGDPAGSGAREGEKTVRIGALSDGSDRRRRLGPTPPSCVRTASGGCSPAHYTEAKTRCAISVAAASAVSVITSTNDLISPRDRRVCIVWRPRTFCFVYCVFFRLVFVVFFFYGSQLFLFFVLNFQLVSTPLAPFRAARFRVSFIAASFSLRSKPFFPVLSVRPQCRLPPFAPYITRLGDMS